MISNAQTHNSAFPPQEALVAMVPRINIEAFCELPQTAETITLASRDRRMLRAHTGVHPGGIMGAVHAYQNQATPNLIIVESRGSRESILSELGHLANVCQPDTQVLVIGHVNDVFLYRELIRQGISEYLVAPLTPIQIIEAIAALYHSSRTAPLGRVVAFIGTKGGVGSSTLAQNCSWSISKTHNTETVIVDLDVAFGTAGLNFNQEIAGGIADVLAHPDRIDAMLLERMLTQVADRLSLLSGPGGVERDFDIQPPAVEAVLTALRASVPLIVLDLPALWAPWVKFALLNADQVVITATPDLASLRNAKGMMELLKAARPNDPSPMIVLNQVGVVKRPEIPAAEFAKAAGAEIAVAIPYDAYSFGVSQTNGQAIFEVAGKSKAADAMSKLALLIAGPANAPKSVKAEGFSLREMISKLRKK